MADLLIKGIDMNTAREKRFLNVHVFIAEGDTMEASAIDIFGKVIGFYDVVEVKPHGRLIDADKLKRDNPRHMEADVPYVTEVTVEEIIDDAPTILEATE